MTILKRSAVAQLAFELARDHPEFNCYDAYDKHVGPGTEARGGAEIGTWNAWTEGWARGLQIHMKAAIKKAEGG